MIYLLIYLLIGLALGIAARISMKEEQELGFYLVSAVLGIFIFIMVVLKRTKI